MRILVFGGAASGKSEYAEQAALRLAGEGERIYVATMRLCDEESRQRVQRHRHTRRGKNFQTVERPDTLFPIPADGASTALLEDLGNLLANRLFAPGADRNTLFDALNEELLRLEQSAGHLVVVSGDLNRDGADYSAGTRDYLDLLSQLHQALSARYDAVVEVVCGLPIFWKGGAV